jgi:hypothetical protein
MIRSGRLFPTIYVEGFPISLRLLLDERGAALIIKYVREKGN